MKSKLLMAFFLFLVLLIFDQAIKTIFVNGFTFKGSILSFFLVYNYGVAFSMFSSFSDYLKYIQITILVIGFVYLLLNPKIFLHYYIPSALIFAGGLGNIIDRFLYGGVVDYIAWHYGFNFPIFNFADVLINIAVVLIFWKQYQLYRREKRAKRKT